MPYGTVNADVIGTSVANSNLGAGNATRFKNRIINGNMVIDQRNAGASTTITTANPYTLDRFQAFTSVSSKYSVQQNAGSVTPPAGFSNYLGVTSLAATTVNATDYYMVSQFVEGFNTADLNFGTANAKTVTLSFWVRSSLTGTFGGSLMNSAENRSYPFNYTISTANTWTQISVTIAGDTSGTWIGSTNGIGLKVWFSLGVGSTFSGTANAWTSSSSIYQPTSSTSVVGTNGATWYVTGVQLEVGSSATGFEYVDYTTQLVMCQRYFQIYTDSLVSGYNGTSGTIYNTTFFPVVLRTTPTVTFSAFTNSNASDAALNSATGQLLRVQIVISSTGAGFSIYTATAASEL